MTTDLSILKKNRDALLFAEMAAWLHDMGKCSDEMITFTAWDKPDNFQYKYKTAYSSLVGDHKIKIFNEEISLRDLIEKGKPNAAKKKSTEPWPIQILGRCHAAAHIEKEEPLSKKEKQDLEKEIKNTKKKVDNKKKGANKKREQAAQLEKKGKGDPDKLRKDAESMCNEASNLEEHLKILTSKIKQCHQSKNNTMISSPFGFELNKLNGLTERLKKLPYNEIEKDQRKMIDDANDFFKNALGDTRRPINEITLSDWSSIVADLYKSALAGALLGNKPEPNDLKWRLLEIRIDSERVLGNVSKIPALLARKEWISEGLDGVKKFLEEYYPLGNEVYRDENGSIFTVPDLHDLLKIQDERKSLEDMISEELGFEGEIVVTPSLSDPWWGQNPSGIPDPTEDKIPPIGDILKKPLHSSPDPDKVKEWWNGVKETETCTISWIRPQGQNQGKTRKTSDYWAERVRGRAKEWYQDRSNTIWIEEVADKNGRICLITGKLDISGWLDPDGHVKTLFVKPPNENAGELFQKNPSFARLRRIWETTKTFWKEVKHDIESAVGNNNKRLIINGEITNKNGNLSQNNVYEIEINRTKATVFYPGNDQLIIIENPEWLAHKMGQPKNVDSSLTYIKNELTSKDVLKIYDPEGNDIDKQIVQITNLQVVEKEDDFCPVVPLLSNPSHFMAIVPANKAIGIAKRIKDRYEKEMGRVRNRLPLSLGLTFARSHTPIMALMDSGRKMIKTPSREESWLLIDDAKPCNGEWTLNFQNGVTWCIPRFMGDGITPDEWYPYFYVEGTPIDRDIKFEHQKRWLVHVSELKKGDAVRIEPSRFDFEFMDSASRRFEVSYDENGKRRDPLKSQRPYLLDDLDDFERICELISKNLSTTQIKNVIGLIETKREEWKVSKDDETFKKFTRDILSNAKWKHCVPPNLDELTILAINGELRDIIELYMDIMKIRKSKNTDDKEVIQ